MGVGTRFREVVRMLPGVRGEIRSTVTRCERDRALEEDFAGAGLRGHLTYGFRAEGAARRRVSARAARPTAGPKPPRPPRRSGILRLRAKEAERYGA